MNAGHPLSVALMRRPRYLNRYTISSGLPYERNAVDAPAHASYSTSSCLFRSVPHVQMEVVGWRWLSAFHGTNILQAGQKGWGRLHLSKITIVYCTWRCTKLIQRLVCVIYLTLQNYTEHPMELNSLGKVTIYILGFVGSGVVAH